MKHITYLIIIIFFNTFPISAFAQQKEAGKGPDNEANRYMNRANVDRLIDAFDSPERAAWQKPNDVIALFGELEGKTIMDLGAGSGYFTFRLANHGANVIAADVNDNFQESIQEKLQKEDFRQLKNKIQLRKVPYDSPELSENEVDGILLVNTYHHIDDRIEYIKKAIRGLKAGGKVIIVDFKTGTPYGPPDSHKLDLKVAANEMLGVGFSRIMIDVEMLERQYVIIGEK
jgi:ubiquinone/menaquinone biosynthesis C-methylase UbiE